MIANISQAADGTRIFVRIGCVRFHLASKENNSTRGIRTKNSERDAQETAFRSSPGKVLVVAVLGETHGLTDTGPPPGGRHVGALLDRRDIWNPHCKKPTKKKDNGDVNKQLKNRVSHQVPGLHVEDTKQRQHPEGV
jgi:hypothetical protein